MTDNIKLFLENSVYLLDEEGCDFTYDEYDILCIEERVL